MEKKSLRSDKMKNGTERTLSRLLMQAGGLTKEQVSKPLIGVIGSYTNLFNGQALLDRISGWVQEGVLMAGGTPAISNTIALCDGIAENTPGMRYPLPSRDIICNSVEAFVEGHTLDGLVCIANCDKIVPGMLMAIMRLNIPAIFISGGPSAPPEDGYDDGTAFANLMSAAALGIDAITNEMQNNTCGPCPGCNSGMGSAVSMQFMSEVLGIAPMGNGTIPCYYNERTYMAKWVGERIVEMVREDLKPSDIISKESFKNALRATMMIGCSTNNALHLPAIAAEAGYSLTLEDFRKASRSTPQIVKLYPSNNTDSVEDFRRAGAVAGVLRQGIEHGYINGDTMTIYGKTIDEMTKDAVIKNSKVIRPFDNPYYKEGGLAVLKGNLSPEGCIIKTGGIIDDMLEHTGRAVCYESEIDFYNEVVSGACRLKPGDCVVIRYEGPVAGPGMREMLTATHLVRSLGMASSVSLITDGRFSGGSVGGVIAHVTPEACKGGLIGLIEDGDIIEYSIPKGTIELKVDEATLAERRAKWVCPPPKFKTGALAQYAALVSPATLGARMIGDMSSLDDLEPIDF